MMHRSRTCFCVVEIIEWMFHFYENTSVTSFQFHVFLYFGAHTRDDQRAGHGFVMARRTTSTQQVGKPAPPAPWAGLRHFYKLQGEKCPPPRHELQEEAEGPDDITTNYWNNFLPPVLRVVWAKAQRIVMELSGRFCRSNSWSSPADGGGGGGGGLFLQPLMSSCRKKKYKKRVLMDLVEVYLLLKHQYENKKESCLKNTETALKYSVFLH